MSESYLKEVIFVLLFNKLYEGDEDEAIRRVFRVLKKLRDYEYENQ